jgi:hypothetical protein
VSVDIPNSLDGGFQYCNLRNRGAPISEEAADLEWARRRSIFPDHRPAF